MEEKYCPYCSVQVYDENSDFCSEQCEVAYDLEEQ
jgi:endogenous inhibitor of DNA gyrase (YacG/DUF329 family)